MRLSLEDGQHGFPEKASLDFERSASDHEQEQGLLDGFNKHSQDPAPSFFTSNLRKSLLWWTIFLAASLGCIAGVLLFLISIKPVTKPQKDGSEINANDYLLDAEWDYSASPRRREYTWTVRDHVHNPDGIYRPMILINNQFPGPMIEVNEGDTIVVHVDNQATNATAIHWHGIYQIGTPYMDGTVGVSQCPIAPGHSFTYEFTVTGQSGTYWWHGHQGLQSSDGLHGPLIIHSRNERSLQKIHYDTDRVIMVTDHYHDLSSALLWQYLMPDVENAEPVPESGLINGRNIRNCDDYPDRRCDNITSNVGRPSFVLDRQQNHRLRIINAGAFAEFSFQIDGHELAVTEVDGTYVHPKSYHRLNISPAQRYSVVISSNSTSDSDTFWMRARMITTCFTDPPKTLQPDVFAVVKYGKDSAGEPTSKDWAEQLDQQCKDMNTTELVPVEEISAPETPDAVYYLRSNFEIGAYRLSRGFFNGSSWRSNPDNSTLQRTIDGLGGASNDFIRPSSSLAKTFVNDRAFNADRELVIQTTGVQTIDILISNFDDGAHPYHLHGYKYFVLAQGYGQPPLTNVGAAITRESLAPLYETLDLSNPLRRDTATADSYGWILLRVVTDNPGAWALHCHVSWHTEAGLLMQLLANTDELAKMKIPKGNQELCAAQGIEKGMGPDDTDYIDFAK